MNVRLMGTPGEVSTATEALRACGKLRVLTVSGPYPNRGGGGQVRVYVTVLLASTPEVIR